MGVPRGIRQKSAIHAGGVGRLVKSFGDVIALDVDRRVDGLVSEGW